MVASVKLRQEPLAIGGPKFGRVVKRRRPSPRKKDKLESIDPSSPWWESTKDRLSLAFDPPELLGRETESELLITSVNEMLSSGRGGAIYISGLPGTGKTLTVSRTLSEMDVDNAQINCATVGESRGIFQSIYNEIVPQRSSGTVTKDMLVATLSDRSKNLFLILDELDFLISRDQTILYALFELPKLCKGSSIVIVGISNAIDLPERLLPWLRAGGCMPVLIPFHSYSSDVLEKILRQRVINQAVDCPALKLCAKKVASTTGDARLALDVCRTALIARKSEPSRPPTLLPEVAKILNQSGGLNAVQSALKTLPLQQQIALCSFLQKVRRGTAEEATLGTLYNTYQVLSRQAGISTLSFPQFVEVCTSSLVHHGLIELRSAAKKRQSKSRGAPHTATSVRFKLARLRASSDDIRKCFQANRVLRDLVQ